MKFYIFRFVSAFICVIILISMSIVPVSAYHSADDNMVSVRSAGSLYESESNDTYLTADRTYSDYDNYGRISSASDIDWWVVKFNSSGYANFWLGNIPSGCDYDIRLYASDGGTLLKSSSKTGNADELISGYWVTGGENYYIRIHSYSGSSASYYQFRTKNYPYHEYAGIMVGGSNQGISAKITTPSSLPDVSDSGESVWVSSNVDSNGEWIQTGARYYSSYSDFKTYTEHYENGVYSLTTVGVHRLGAEISYKVEYNASDGKWHAYIVGKDKASSALATVNVGVQAHAEIHKKEIEMGPFTFSDVQIKNSSSIWVNNIKLPTAAAPYTATGTAANFTVSGPNN